MPLFVIIGHDVADSQALRAKVRPEHLARLEQLAKQNRLVLAGPTPIAYGKTAMSGSVVVAEFDDEASAKAWLDDEPYLREGVYSHAELRPFVQVLP